jgi:hypothetical protein
MPKVHYKDVKVRIVRRCDFAKLSLCCPSSHRHVDETPERAQCAIWDTQIISTEFTYIST